MHRHVKADDVKVRNEGMVSVLEFGLAKGTTGTAVGETDWSGADQAAATVVPYRLSISRKWLKSIEGRDRLCRVCCLARGGRIQERLITCIPSGVSVPV